ncbi:uroporphyrinogen-III C-methyltransferase [Cardiobacterium hominis]|uniref:uroporphyrinogen-III C-methyltransferase n=1 Tax=Cardiobacterium hominis TaxID=2718 RepID=UPI0028E80C14|nr:uroporphyrinogen-III C-methyltransferase [Cardiobacterium hominis]
MTEEKQPENQHETSPVVAQEAPLEHQPAAPKNGRGLALLALLVSIATAGAGIYALKQFSDSYDRAFTLQAKAQESALQHFASTGQVDDLTLRVEALNKQTQVLNNLDSTINTAIAANQLSEDQIAALVAANSINREQAESLIKQALATFAQGETKIDLSKEIAAVEKSEAAAKAAVQQIDDKAQTFAREIDEKRVLIEHALAQSNNSINPFPLINALKMAQIAANDGNYNAAKAYLEQAGATYTLFNLGQSNYAQYQDELAKLRSDYAVLAAQATPAAQIDAIITTLPAWPYKNVDPLAHEETVKAADWKERLKGIGADILKKTITVREIDDAGLTWIQANDALQIILKENLRLDLAYARNALQLHDQAAYAATADRLHAEIERLFDVNNDNVAAALATLEALKNSGGNAPDIAALIEKLEQAAKE